MKSSGPTPEPGQIVAVRQRLYLVDQSIPPVNLGDSPLIQLSCVDYDAQGQPLEVLWERELDGQVITLGGHPKPANEGRLIAGIGVF